MDHIVSKSRQRLKIFKYIAGKDWGADAVTLRNTYMALLRPMEYGFPVFSCASDTNLDKLEKIQLSAARIITGLRRSCPREIVLFKADLKPLKTRRASLTKYFNKRSSYGQHNKTSPLYLNNWCNNQRLKKNSPFSQAELLQLPFNDVVSHSLKSCLSSAKGIQKDKAGVSIVQKLIQISESHDVHFQWIPSHVNIFGNEQANLLTKEGCNASPPIFSTLTYSEHRSRVKSEILRSGGPRPTITGMKANIQDRHSYLNVAEPLRLQSLD
ncbi:putative RNA-directed DNA polymerase from transposon BS [Trichonephila clavipes]|uniref:Putative RNA-directed DNA polymerase from transposon BS n=1 Tax=Trichonephila clavipes TaxID=2585209 RepID=A0A8X6RFC5_TRICX|nr:putative RNA-directed DNA polymerase from transposon BS [Trichonephila clavipes]